MIMTTLAATVGMKGAKAGASDDGTENVAGRDEGDDQIKNRFDRLAPARDRAANDHAGVVMQGVEQLDAARVGTAADLERGPGGAPKEAVRIEHGGVELPGQSEPEQGGAGAAAAQNMDAAGVERVGHGLLRAGPGQSGRGRFGG